MAKPSNPIARALWALLQAIAERFDFGLGRSVDAIVEPLSKLLDAVWRYHFGESLLPEPKRAPVDLRLAKLDAARAALEESLQAINELQQEGIRAKAEHAIASVRLESVLASKGDAEKQLAELRAFYELDMAVFRQLAGTPNMGVERFVAFLLGIVASIVATVVWTYSDDFFGWLGGLFG